MISLTFSLSKSIDFKFVVLLKILSLLPSLKVFGIEIWHFDLKVFSEISRKQTKAIFSTKKQKYRQQL